MAVQTRISSPDDREGITDLMRRAFGDELSPTSINPAFQRWKYWDEHPLMVSARSYLLNGAERIVGHACRWPMRILIAERTFDAFHLIDWAADSTHAGAGLQVLQDSFENSAALFSIGGSPVTRRMLPALGKHLSRRANQGKAVSYRVAGRVFFLNRALKVVAPALHESPLGWRTPARVVKNALLSVLPIPRLPANYSYERVALNDIPHQLWPRPGSEFAATARTPELMQHFESCPVLQRPMYFLVSRQRTPLAYFFLVLAAGQARVADFGPAALDASAAAAVGTAAQLAARRYYPEALRITTVTSEPTVRAGFLQSGFRQSYEEEIRGLIVEPALQPVKQYRLTYLDLDAVGM